MLLEDGVRYVPGRILFFADDLCRTQGCIPAFTPDAEGVGYDLVVVLRKIVESQLRQIDDDAGAGSGRQDISLRDDNFGSLTRQPGIHLWIGILHLSESDIVKPCNVGKGVFEAGLVLEGLANQIIAFPGHGEVDGVRSLSDQQHQYGSKREQ